MEEAYKTAELSGETKTVAKKLATSAAAAAAADKKDQSQVKLQSESCFSEEKGICEGVLKCLCCYAELQFPPSTSDIGIAWCGCRCNGGRPPYKEPAEPKKEAEAEQVAAPGRRRCRR